MYLVSLMARDIEVASMGQLHSVNLSWSPGMIGALPVFGTYEEALAYADNDEDLIIILKEAD